MTQRCEDCRFWSEMIAEAWGCGPVRAFCLSVDSPNHTKMMSGSQSCDAWADGDLGAVDAPPLFGSQYADEATT